MTEDRSRQRLGRGLASLIGAGADAPARPVPGFEQQPDAPAVAPEYTIALDRIRPSSGNPRRAFDDTDLAELAESIRHHGVVQPLLIRSRPGVEGRFELVAGERRWRAAKLAGLTEVPVVLREIDDRQALEIAIIENVQRSDLTAVDEALGYQRLIDEHGYTQADLADVLGKSRSHVANTLRLLKLPEGVRSMVAEGALSPGAARTLVTAEDPVATARTIVDRGLTVRQAEKLARDGTEEPTPASAPARPSRSRGRSPDASPNTAPKDADALALEKLLSDALGMPVDITVSGDSGSIRIDYGDLTQLDDICARLQQRAPSARG